MTTVSRVAFVMYPVSDMARAVTFYRDVVGLQQDGLASDFWTEFDTGGSTFGIGTFEQVGKAGTAQSLAIEVDDIAAFRAALIERGAEVTEPHDLPNCMISEVRDPDGNRIWLHQVKAR